MMRQMKKAPQSQVQRRKKKHRKKTKRVHAKAVGLLG
jgi:hypothetical protein